MKVQGNRYINNPEMIKNKVEKKTTVPQNIISEDDVKVRVLSWAPFELLSFRTQEFFISDRSPDSGAGRWRFARF